MTVEQLTLQDRAVIALVSGVLGVILTIVTQRILGKRSLFAWSVWHTSVGISAVDDVFGAVQVLWNDTLVANLYLSTVEVRNESLRDFANVTVQVVADGTDLLTEKAELVGLTESLRWTDGYAERIRVAPGAEPTDAQRTWFRRKRDYLVPTFNRGQVVRIVLLNAADLSRKPFIKVEVDHPGVKTRFKVTPDHLWGVPRTAAALIGTAICGALVVAVVLASPSVWLASLISFLLGWLVFVPGALIIKLGRWARNLIGD